VIISLFGTVLGLAFGLVGGWGIVRSLRDEGFGVFEVPVVPFVVLAIVGALVGVGASVWPAWRASRMNVLDAIATE
jgi:putative ABC transport system permease protein